MAGDADIASHLSVIFDVRLSSKSGYVYQSYKIDEIVKEWELCTNSSFTDVANKPNYALFSHLFTI